MQNCKNAKKPKSGKTTFPLANNVAVPHAKTGVQISITGTLSVVSNTRINDPDRAMHNRRQSCQVQRSQVANATYVVANIISLQKSNTVSMDTTSFLQAEGQEVIYMRALSPIAILSRNATLQNANVSLETYQDSLNRKAWQYQLSSANSASYNSNSNSGIRSAAADLTSQRGGTNGNQFQSAFHFGYENRSSKDY